MQQGQLFIIPTPQAGAGASGQVEQAVHHSPCQLAAEALLHLQHRLQLAQGWWNDRTLETLLQGVTEHALQFRCQSGRHLHQQQGCPDPD